MKIEYYRRDVYGQETLYIADGSAAAPIKTLTGKKTVNAADIGALVLLGHELAEVPQPRKA